MEIVSFLPRRGMPNLKCEVDGDDDSKERRGADRKADAGSSICSGERISISWVELNSVWAFLERFALGYIFSVLDFEALRYSCQLCRTNLTRFSPVQYELAQDQFA